MTTLNTSTISSGRSTPDSWDDDAREGPPPSPPSAAAFTPPPAAVLTFASLGLPASVQRGPAVRGFATPSSVQAEAIPALLGGLDVAAAAPSGSGKTMAFALPALALVDPKIDAVQALILAPTGLLAAQLAEVIEGFAADMGRERPRVALLSGGTTADRPSSAQIVVATPMKLLDLCGLMARGPDRAPLRSPLSLAKVRLCVFDEADELLYRPEFVEQVAKRSPNVEPI